MRKSEKMYLELVNQIHKEVAEQGKENPTTLFRDVLNEVNARRVKNREVVEGLLSSLESETRESISCEVQVSFRVKFYQEPKVVE